MSYAARIADKSQKHPVWVVQLAGATYQWYSSIPLTAEVPTDASDTAPYGGAAVPILEPVGLPARTMSLTGGDSTVTSLVFKLQDVKGADWKATSVFYAPLGGTPVKVYFGYNDDTTWNATNFPMLWSGYIVEAQYADGVWTVTCEDSLSRAKGAPLDFPEFTAEIQTQLTHSALSLVLQNCLGDLTESANTDLLDGDGDFEDAADLTPWVSNNEGDGGDPVLSQSNTQKHSGTYAMKAVIAAADAGDECTATYYKGGDYIALPAGHKPGDSYGVAGWWYGTGGTTRVLSATLCIYGIKADGTIQEYAVTPCGVRATTSAWASQSVVVTVYHPDTTALKVVWEYSGWATDAGENPVDVSFFFDDVTVRKIDSFLALGNEVVGVESWAADTCTATICRSALGTINCTAAVDTKVRRVTPVCGFGGDIILRLLTTTSAGTNGDYDYGDGIGCGIPAALVDETALEALRATYTYHTWMLIQDAAIPDALELLDAEILKPWGASLGLSNRGLITAFVLPSSVASGTYSLTDDLALSHPTVKGSNAEVINTVVVQSDFDHLDAVRTDRDSNPAVEKVDSKDKTKYDRDAKYISLYKFDEQDHRVDFVYKDQNLTSRGLYGEKVYALKTKGVRGVYSAQLSMPVLRFNYGSEYLVQKGEEMLRHLAERLITYYNSRVHAVTYPTFMWALDSQPGDTVSLTSSYLPDLNPSTGGGVGVSAVKGFVRQVSFGEGTVTLECVMADWAAAPAADQPAYDTPTDPGATNVGAAWVTSADFRTGVYETAPKSNVNALRFLHNYGGTACTLPTANKWARTEIRRYLNNALGYSTAARTSSIGVIVAGSASSSAQTRSSKVLWLLKDGTYSTAYTVSSV